MTLVSHCCSKIKEEKPSKSSGEVKSGEMQNKKLVLGAKGKMKAKCSVSSLHRGVSSQKM